MAGESEGHSAVARCAALASAACLTVGIGAGFAAAPAAAAPSGPSITTVHFAVTVGPGEQHCDIIGDLYRPPGASADAPVPAILATNGFGGSKDDMASAADYFAGRGYAVLTYSGLGFGGSGCRIGMDSREQDGRAGSQLIGFLGGRTESHSPMPPTPFRWARPITSSATTPTITARRAPMTRESA